MGVRYKIINRKKYQLVRLADALLTPLEIAHKLAGRHPVGALEHRDRIRKILAIRLAYMGDAVMTLPALKALKAAFPAAQLEFLTCAAAAPLFRNLPFIDAVVPMDAPWFYPRSGVSAREISRRIRERNYDLGVDFRGDIRNIFHCLWRPGIPLRVSFNSGGGGALLTHPVPWRNLTHKITYHLELLRGVGIPAEPDAPNVIITKEEAMAAEKTLENLTGQGSAPIGIHPGARLPLKRWPESRFVELVRLLRDAFSVPIVLFSGGEDARALRIQKAAGVPGVHVLPVMPVRLFAAVLSRCACLVCHDSAPMHIAAAVGTPVTALFGPSRPVETAPAGAGHAVLEGPCRKKDDCDEQVCLVDDEGACIRSISVKAVFEACKSVLSGCWNWNSSHSMHPAP